MSKKSRLVLILAVLGVCFAFLWPTISWYYRTPKEDQAIALRSLEGIKDYSEAMAAAEYGRIEGILKADPSAILDAEYDYIVKAAERNYKDQKADVPSPMTVRDALKSFESQDALVKFIETKYRNKILADRRNYQNSVKLGLDLNGGINVIVKADLDKALEERSEESTLTVDQMKAEIMENAVSTLSSSIDRYGLSSPVIRQQGDDRIYIELPGSSDNSAVSSIIEGRGSLSFRLVNDDATSKFNTYYFSHRVDTFNENGKLSAGAQSLVPEDCEVMGFYVVDDYGIEQRHPYRPYVVVEKAVLVNGQMITSAEIGREELTNKLQVNFRLNSEGADKFAELTGKNTGRNLCIVSDGRVKQIAGIDKEILGGSVALTGAFSQQEAENIRKLLKTAVLNVPLSIESQQVVGADLGEEAIHQGVMAIGIGLIAIMIFMLIWYKGAGINACVAQVLNLYIMFSILSALNLTVTLPMIAGMILTIGMAVDANVIIFERIKEERVLGKDRASSVAAGFGNALWAILDSNITTFIAAAFMSQLGSGSIQGFSYSLAIGVVSTVFTALVVSRLMFDFGTQAMHKKNISISWRIK